VEAERVPRFDPGSGVPIKFLSHHGRPEQQPQKGREIRESVRHADVAQLVAHHLAKVRVASSSLVVRSAEGPLAQANVLGLAFRKWRSGRVA
jgi:hypothetical protein